MANSKHSTAMSTPSGAESFGVQEIWQSLLARDSASEPPDQAWRQLVAERNGEDAMRMLELLRDSLRAVPALVAWMDRQGTAEIIDMYKGDETTKDNTLSEAEVENLADFWEAVLERAQQEIAQNATKRYFSYAVIGEVHAVSEAETRYGAAGWILGDKGTSEEGIGGTAAEVIRATREWIGGLDEKTWKTAEIEDQEEIVRSAFFEQTPLIGNKANAHFLTSACGKSQWHAGKHAAELAGNPHAEREAVENVFILSLDLRVRQAVTTSSTLDFWFAEAASRMREDHGVLGERVVKGIREIAANYQSPRDLNSLARIITGIQEAVTDKQIQQEILKGEGRAMNGHLLMPHLQGAEWLETLRICAAAENTGPLRWAEIAGAMKLSGDWNMKGLTKDDLAPLMALADKDVREHVLRLILLVTTRDRNAAQTRQAGGRKR